MRPGYLPNQHGAWAMLIVPFLFGVFASRPVPLHALLFAAWLCAYLFAFAMLQWMRTGKTRIYRTPVLIYGGLAGFGAATLILEPSLAELSPLFVPMLLVNMHYARRNRERALINDLAAIVQFSLIIFAACRAGGGTNLGLAAELFAFSVLYFAGTALYVKTMIREKNNPVYYRISVGYHLVLLVACAAWYPPGLLVPLAVLLIRAAWTPRLRITVKRSGMLEIAYAAIVLAAAALTYAGGGGL